jgi:hypothetical protein
MRNAPDAVLLCGGAGLRLRQGKCIKGFVCSGRCVDIGAPERYRNAQSSLAKVEMDTSPCHRGSDL